MSDLRFPYDSDKGFSDLVLDGGDFLLSDAVTIQTPNPNASDGVYAYWYDGSEWLISSVEDVGSLPSNYFKLQDYPDTITVSGAGEAEVNQEYEYAGTYSSNPYWNFNGDDNDSIRDFGPAWEIILDSIQQYQSLASGLPPKSPIAWNPTGGASPAPTLTYTIPTDQYVGQGSWSGTITFSSAVPAPISISSDAVPEELRGAIVWVDSGFETNGESVYYSKAIVSTLEVYYPNVTLQIAVELSLFTDRRATADEIEDFQPNAQRRASRRGYWANTFRDYVQGSGLWLLERAKKTATTLSRAQTYATTSLAWMVTEGVAKSVNASASFDGDALILIVTITKPDGQEEGFRFQFAWDSLEVI